MKTDLFQSCGHCWVFQICWHIECSTFTASSFRIWNSTAGIPSPPLASWTFVGKVMSLLFNMPPRCVMAFLPRSKHLLNPGMWSQVGLRKYHYEQSWWRWWNSSWAISNPKRWCWESAALNMPASLENSAVATGLEKVSFHSSPKERQCQRMLKLLHNCTHLAR